MVGHSVDYVYHLTPSDRLESLTNGLIPNPNRGMSEEWRQLEREVDLLVPEWVALLGISRAKSVYAHAEQEFINGIFDLNTRSREKAAAHLVALQIEVTPQDVVVCDAFPLNYRFNPNAAHDYWATAMTLQQYRDWYWQEDPWFHIVKRKNAPAGSPMTLVQPEVLVPGPIEPQRLTWFASSARPMSEHKYKNW